MSLTQRYHDSLTEKIDSLEFSAGQYQREIKAEFHQIERRAVLDAEAYQKISELNEQWHEGQKKLLSARQELLEFNDKFPTEGIVQFPHPEEQ